jgi:hypothetical protein
MRNGFSREENGGREEKQFATAHVLPVDKMTVSHRKGEVFVIGGCQQPDCDSGRFCMSL